MRDKKHLLHLIMMGVYFGFSDESIIEFLQEFDVCCAPGFDRHSRDQRGMHGLIVSRSEFETQTLAQIVNGINLRRFCSTPWPNQPVEAVWKDEVSELMRTRLDFRNRVRRLFNAYPREGLHG